jgi:glycosyltransferase involved in cell wall biosynthesis
MRQVIYAWNYVDWGGVQIYFLSLMRFVSRKYKVKAILPENSAEKLLTYLKSNNIEFEFFPSEMDRAAAGTVVRRIERRINDYLCNLSLARKLSRQDLENSLVQIDAAPWTSLTLLLYLAYKTDTFVTFHTPLPEIAAWRKLLWKLKFGTLTKFDNFHLAASNQKVKESLQPFISSEIFEKIQVAYSSVDIDEIDGILRNKPSRNVIAEKYDFSAEKFWLCNVGQFIERKGCWILLNALKNLVRTQKNVFFYWLGTSPLSNETLEKVNSYGLDEHFRFLSADEIGQNRSDLFNLLAETDLFVMPSLEEGLPVALIEAMAVGKCCIASDINAIPEAVEHLKTGFLIPPNDSSALENAILNLMNDETARRNIGAAAREKVVEKFNDKKTGETMLELYEKAFDKRAIRTSF